jgi:imidazoleglycerol phosphate dehydratase HisB
MRESRRDRRTNETTIRCRLSLDGTRQISVATGIGFLDHLLSSLAFHAGWDLELACTGDLEVDDHHTAEDCALALGEALDRALEDRRGIVRFGSAYAPLDESLARAVVDLSGRPWPEIHLGLEREMLGGLATENVTHVLVSLAIASRCSLHVDVIRGSNEHHRAEAAFKAVALALRQAIRITGDSVPSTKGALGSDRGGPK